MTRPDIVQRIIGFLREGYPQDAPAQGYAPVLALLRQRLSDEEVLEFARSLSASFIEPIDRAAIRRHVEDARNDVSESDVQRVQEQLWRLADAPPLRT